jgi:two-component system, chemotaxis family, protein-glutamate methylesterase/glutaminase
MSRGDPAGSPVNPTVPPVVVIGASAGGVSVLGQLMAMLPDDLPVAVLVVLHVNPSGTSVLPEILSRAGVLPVAHATNGEPLCAGVVRVAPPDHHLVVAGDHLEVTKGPRENGHRPAIDPLFASAARSRGASVLGVVLSGTLDDGVAGLRSIHDAGGITVVQDPDEAQFPAMPLAALAAGVVDHVLEVGDIAKLICELDMEPAPVVSSAPGSEIPDAPDRYGDIDQVTDAPVSPSSIFTCPSCGGPLHIEQPDARVATAGVATAGPEIVGVETYACRVGHRYATESLLEAQDRVLDDALWAAYRSLREQADLCRRVAARLDWSAARASAYRRAAEHAERRARVLHSLLTDAQAAAIP